MADAQRFLRDAIELARANLESGGRPFGAVIVKDGEVIATGVNEIESTNDPTAHAELTASARLRGSSDLRASKAVASMRAAIPVRCASRPCDWPGFTR